MSPTQVSPQPIANVAALLEAAAQRVPQQVAVVQPIRRAWGRTIAYRCITFHQLDEDSHRLASGLADLGVRPGMRVVLMVPPGVDFVALVFALFKLGAVLVLIDPGMGRKSLVRCLEEVEPDGFVAVPVVHVLRHILRRRFPKARCNVTVGTSRWWCRTTIADLRAACRSEFHPAAARAQDPAAIIFTTGSTGPPKGVLYRHGNFHAQVELLRRFYGIEPGEIDLSGFPLFALFNAAMAVTTVIPDMDPTRPARAHPRRIVQNIRDWQPTQAFGSPALWNVVGRYCERRGIRLPSLRRVFSAGAPVPPHVLRSMKQAIRADGDVHTPYGATEALPIASISASQLLAEAAAERDDTAGDCAGNECRTGLKPVLPRSQPDHTAGACVGRRFPGIEWKVIAITDDPIETIDRIQEMQPEQIGELIVSGPVVTSEYVTQVHVNRLAKIRDGGRLWHRMGDAGYLDKQDRFWFCGRKAHRVVTSSGTMFTIPCEAIFNRHPLIYRSALVGVGDVGQQTPVIICQPWPGRMPRTRRARRQLEDQLFELGQANAHTRSIQRRHILLHPSLPVDIRHNAKIFREQLAIWAARKLRSRMAP